ncbi:MAG: IS481 family transposase [Bacteroidales bacterium]|nr:IS481 family transposase [Bacteroidales bacterium]
MTWKESTKMDQKIEFINEWRSGISIAELCREFEISRPTAYKYIKRYQEEGIAGLEEKSRIHQDHPAKTPSDIEERILFYRKNHSRWGGKKIWKCLHRDFSAEQIPSVTTVNRILKRNGLVTSRKRRRKVKAVHPIFDPQACNEVWSADFKGKFKLGNQRYCHTLTIADSYSRFIFSAKGLYGEKFEPTMLEFRKIFNEYGMPLQIHTDNGSPFGAVQAVKRLTRLAVWFIELGIEPVYSDPASPQQNGRHERMHQDLKQEATRPPGYSLRAQQRKLNKFVNEYNYERPHEAIGLETPGSIHEYSPRPFKKR